MGLLIKCVREGLGRTVLFADWVSRPSPRKLTPEQQGKFQADAQNLSLYQHRLCPFCVKVRRVLHKLNLTIELQDIKKDPNAREMLEKEGGRVKVPCLRIQDGDQVQWMYESNDIIQYLEKRFA